MDRFWLAQYPSSVPADIDPFEIDSLKSLIEDACSRYADRIAYHSMGTAMTYRELARRSHAFGAWLQHRAGLTVVNTNPLYTAAELEHQLKDSGAVAVVVLENFAATLEQALPETRVRQAIVTGVGDMLRWPKGPIVNLVLRHVHKKVPRWVIPEAHGFRQVLAAGRSLRLLPVNLDRSDIAYLQYTGVAKGAMLTHGNMVANILQSRAWFQQVALDRATFVCALPLYHIFSLTANCWLFASLGGTGLMIANPRDFPAFVKDLRRHPPMFFMGVNTLFNALMHTPGFAQLDFSGLV